MDKNKSADSNKPTQEDAQRLTQEGERSPSHLRGADGPCAVALAELEKQGRRVHVLGHIREGRLEIDQRALDEVTKRFPDAIMSFVAVNAPFDPVPLHGE